MLQDGRLLFSPIFVLLPRRLHFHLSGCFSNIFLDPDNTTFSVAPDSRRRDRTDFTDLHELSSLLRRTTLSFGFLPHHHSPCSKSEKNSVASRGHNTATRNDNGKLSGAMGKGFLSVRQTTTRLSRRREDFPRASARVEKRLRELFVGKVERIASMRHVNILM